MKTETIDVWIPIFANENPIKTLKELDKVYFYTNPIDGFPHKYKLKARLEIEVPETAFSDITSQLRKIIKDNVGENDGGLYGVGDAVAEILKLIREN